MSTREQQGRREPGDAGEDARPQEPPSAQRTATYPMSRLSAPIGLVDMAREIEAADTVLGAAVGSELEAIARQMRALRAQAEEALQRARRDAELHRATCRFRKRPGAIYHLYRGRDGRTYFSMLSPEDWKGRPPDTHAGSYRLEADMRWTPIDELESRDRERAAMGRMLGG